MATFLQQVTKEIEQKRDELYDNYRRYGFLHSKTIQCSQELDILLNQLFNVRRVRKNNCKILNYNTLIKDCYEFSII